MCDVRKFGAVAADIVADLKFRRLVGRVHALGPRVVAELLAEIAAERSIMVLIEQKLERYAALPVGVVEALNAAEMPAVPLRQVPWSDEDDGA